MAYAVGFFPCSVPVAAYFSPQSQAADFKLHPTLSVSEEYTDNVYETEDNKRYDYITRAQPGLAMKYIAPLGLGPGIQP